MSCWIVSKEHIDLLVSAGAEMTGMDPDELGKMLWEENHNSVNSHYTEQQAVPPYTFEPPPETVKNNGKVQPVSPVVLIKAINCYEYQSCEHEGWEVSKAHEFCKDLKKSLFPNKVMTEEQLRELPGYDDAPWGIGG